MLAWWKMCDAGTAVSALAVSATSRTVQFNGTINVLRSVSLARRDPKSGVFRVTTNVSSGIRPLDATGEPPMRFALLNKAPCTMYQTQFFAFTQCSQLVPAQITESTALQPFTLQPTHSRTYLIPVRVSRVHVTHPRRPFTTDLHAHQSESRSRVRVHVAYPQRGIDDARGARPEHLLTVR